MRDDAGSVTIDTLVARAKALVPAFRDRAEETEERRSLPEKTMEDLHASGLLKYYQPKRFGGFELDWGAHFYTANEIARGCGSTAWVQSVVGSHTWMAARFGLEAQEEIFADPDLLIATAFAGGRNVSIRRVEGGFRLSGEWAFASGLPHSGWAIVGTQAETATRDVYEMTLFALPKGDYDAVDNWHVSGLRGTASQNITVEDQFIPDHRSITMSSFNAGNAPGADLHESYIYRVNMPEYFYSVPLGPMVGSAIGAMETYLDITRSRIGAMFGEKIAEQIPVQTRIAESSVEIAVAKLLAGRLFTSLHERGSSGEAVYKDEMVRNKRDSVYIGKCCEQSIDRLIRMMGASGLYDNNPVQRFFRDIRAMTAHQSQQWEVGMAPFGKWALGLETGNEIIDSLTKDGGELF